MTRFAKIDVKDITSNLLRANFLQEDIEKLANLILDCDGLLRPLILKPTGVESYAVLAGHLEYFAAIRAREKNPRKGEMVHAFVIDAKDEKVIEEQIEILTGSSASSPTVIATSNSVNSDWIGSFETRLSQMREELFQKNRELESRLSQVEKQKTHIDLLEFINTASQEELIEQLSFHGIKKAQSEELYNLRNLKESKKFTTYKEFANDNKNKPKVMGSSLMITLIDSWARVNKK